MKCWNILITKIMTDKKPKNVFKEGAISTDFIANSIAKHQVKTGIGAHNIFLGQVRADEIDHKVVSAIEYVDTHETVEGPAVIIRIFLSVLNVHINRTPCDCVLLDAKYRKGKFLDARSEESAKVNESNTLFFEYAGEKIGIRQVSGKIARNIVCPIQVGDVFTQGRQFGMIKFGSTTELILPRPNDVTVHVKRGEAVTGGITRFATLTPR